MIEKYPKISIITPSYNHGEFIEDTIVSVLSQNYPNLEYIIIDGGSTDDTIKIIEKYQDRIDFWISEKDRGQSHAINKGFYRATGEIINWLNSDDMLAENALFEIAKAFQKSPDCLMISSLGWSLFSTGEKKMVDRLVDKNSLKYISSFPYLQPACFFRKAVLDEIGYLDEGFEITMDRDLYVRIALKGQIDKLKFPVAIFRIHEKQKTFKFNEIWHQNRLKVLSRLIRTFSTTKSYISSLNRSGLYHDESISYNCYKKMNAEEVNEILADYLTELAYINYASRRFLQTHSITAWLKRYLPDYYTRSFAQLHYRSLVLFKIPFAFQVVEMIKKIKKYLP